MNILIKFSGEFFTPTDDLTETGHGFLKQIVNLQGGYLVVGGGNRVRGKNSAIDRNTADQLGVLGTIMNGIVLQENLIKLGQEAVLYSHFSDFGKKYSPSLAIKDFNKKRWVVLSSGLGRVGFISTDLSAVIKALELKVDAMIKVTNVGGVYTDDPVKNPSAKLVSRLSYKEVLENRLAVLDLSAMEVAAENHLPIGVISADSFLDFVNGKECGSIVGCDWRMC